MKTRNVAMMFVAALFWASTALYAQPEGTDGHAHIGVLLDPKPLPELLTKHLGLSPGQGVRIQNVNVGSPADKAGLERDDIIIAFEGEDVENYEYDRFVDRVRKAGVGAEVALEVIHLGQRKTVKLTLEAFKDDFDLKYPPEPQILQSWQPGKIFRLRPGDKGWTEILRDDMPEEFRTHINKLFKKLYTFHHSVDGEDCTITIEGNPDDEDTLITVRIGETEYKTTLKQMDKLPEKYREAAEKALENIRRTSRRRKLDGDVDIPVRKQRDWKDYFERLSPRSHPPAPQFGPGDEMFDKIQKQMQELQKRIEELEKHQSQAPKPDEQKPKEPQKEPGQEV